VLFVFPPEPPVAIRFNRDGAQRARARWFCAAQRTLAGEHRSDIRFASDGRLGEEHNASRW
jgi:hypothetical protein